MKQNSLQKWISNDNVGRAVAVLNKPWFHSEDEQVCAAQTILLMVSDVPLAQEVLELLKNENSIQKYVIDTLISKVLHCPTKYYSNKELQSIGLQNLTLLVEQCATESVYDPLEKLSAAHYNNGTIVELKVKDYKYQEGFHYYQVDYNGSPCLVKMMPYEAGRYEDGRRKKTIICRDMGPDDNGLPFLVEDKGSLIEELYKEDTVQTFTYCYSKTISKELRYHVVMDEYGLTHRYYGRLHVQQKKQFGKIDFYIKDIDPKSKTLTLEIYDPTIERKVNEWYDADRIFGEIEEADSKKDLFENVLSKKDNLTKSEEIFQKQYRKQSNRWLFTFLNILDTEIIPNYIRRHQIEELSMACSVMIKLQNWLVEGATFLDLFNDKRKNDIITKSKFQIESHSQLLKAIDVIKDGRQDNYLTEIIRTIGLSKGTPNDNKENIQVLFNILRICPGYLVQNIEKTCELIRALLSGNIGISKSHYNLLIRLVEHSLLKDIRKLEKTAYQSNEVDSSDTVLIHEVLSLLMLKSMYVNSEINVEEKEQTTEFAIAASTINQVSNDNLGAVDVIAGDEPNSKAHHVNLDVVFYSNNTLSLEERRNSNIEIDDCYRIQLPESDDNCSLVLFMKDNSFKGIPLSEITCMREGERISTDVNFYKIKNWFVAPKDTIVGARIVISGCAYAAFLTIDNNYESTLADSSLTGVESCQPFIIPKECLGKDVNKLLGRKVQVDEIQDKTVRELQSYGVFIN